MGSTTSKSSSIIETLNETVNEVVNKSSNIIKTIIQSRQIIKASCTEEQLKNANDSYVKLYELWVKYGSIGNPPKQIMCSIENINQDSAISLKTDDNSKMQLQSEIEKQLSNLAKQKTKESLEQPILGLSDSQIEATLKIKNNILNKTYSENLKEAINTLLVEQTIDLNGMGAANLNQKTVVNLISSAIIESITKNVDKSVISNTSDQTKDVENKSALGGVFNNLISTIGSVINSAINMFGTLGVIFIFAGILFIYLFRCMIPPLFFLCFTQSSSNNNRNNKNDDRNYDRKSNNNRNNKNDDRNL
jgi:hypothetical protein